MSNLREIECVKRMLEKGMLEELKEFLIEQELAFEADFHEHRQDYQMASFITVALRAGTLDKKKIQLVDYEWVILPTEYAKLTVVTENEKREFTFGL